MPVPAITEVVLRRRDPAVTEAASLRTSEAVMAALPEESHMHDPAVIEVANLRTPEAAMAALPRASLTRALAVIVAAKAVPVAKVANAKVATTGASLLRLI